MGGFTYNGVSCEKFGLYYIPTKEDQWFSDPEYDVYDQDIDWRHGGIYFTSKAKVRTFTLKCFFEEIDIATKQAIKEWVRRDSGGKLIFDDMPFIYWNVRPGKIPVGNWYLDSNESHSGTVTITFNAYEPFGYLLRKANGTSPSGDHSEDYTNMIMFDEMPADPTTSSTSFDIYNPGTEECGLNLEVAGSLTTGYKFRFFNETNGSYCAFESLPENNIRVEVNGDTGYISTHLANSDQSENGFAYHDKGVVKLSPNIGASDIEYKYEGFAGTTYGFTLYGYPVTNAIKNAKLKIPGVNTTFTIVSVSAAINRIYCSAEDTVTPPEEGTCSFQTVNHIRIEENSGSGWVTPATHLTLSYISVDYKPRAM